MVSEDDVQTCTVDPTYDALLIKYLPQLLPALDKDLCKDQEPDESSESHCNIAPRTHRQTQVQKRNQTNQTRRETRATPNLHHQYPRARPT